MRIAPEKACYLLMSSALTNGTQVVLFQNPRDANTWRHSCYKMRRFLKAANDDKFKDLRFSVKKSANGAELTVERKDGQAKIHSDSRVD